jgi:hypothetical protein
MKASLAAAPDRQSSSLQISSQFDSLLDNHAQIVLTSNLSSHLAVQIISQLAYP